MFFWVIVRNVFEHDLKIFSCSIKNGMISTIDLVTKMFLIIVQKHFVITWNFGAMLENIGRQIKWPNFSSIAWKKVQSTPENFQSYDGRWLNLHH